MAFQILSLSGGAYLGLYTARVLEELERRSGRPIGARFDLIAGTSVGGLIALAVAAEVPAAEIRRALEDEGAKIFPGRPWPGGRLGGAVAALRMLFRAPYKTAHLRAAIGRTIGPDVTLSGLKRRVVVPAVNLSEGRPVIFRTPHRPGLPGAKADAGACGGETRVCDVALATAAAPAFFPVHRIGGALYADGGLYATAPDLIALDEAEHVLGAAMGDIRMLSIGTTTARFRFAPPASLDVGVLHWAANQHLLRAIIGTQQASVAALAAARLGERYVRIDCVPTAEQDRHLGLDIATPAARQILNELGAASAREMAESVAHAAILGHEGVAWQEKQL